MQAPKVKPASGAKKPKESAEHKRLRLEEEARAAETGMRFCPLAILGAQGPTLPSASSCLAQSASAWRQRLKSRRRTTSCAAKAWLRSDRPHRTRRSALKGALPVTLTSFVLTPASHTRKVAVSGKGHWYGNRFQGCRAGVLRGTAPSLRRGTP